MAIFPQAPSGYFLPSPWRTRYLQETPRAHTKAHYLLHGLGHSPNTWVGTKVRCNKTDVLLFATCTTITLENSEKTELWLSGWFQYTRFKDIAPLLYAKTRKKKHSVVAVVLHNNNWIRVLTTERGPWLLTCSSSLLSRTSSGRLNYDHNIMTI
jgi:hypothetical protein